MGACDIPLQKYFQDLSNGILLAPKYLKCQLVSQEKQICNYLATAENGGQKNHNEKTTTILFAMFSTSVCACEIFCTLMPMFLVETKGYLLDLITLDPLEIALQCSLI